MDKVKTMWERHGAQGFESYVRIVSDTTRQAFDYAASHGLKSTSARWITVVEEIDIRNK